jgi:hypothetical protein
VVAVRLPPAGSADAASLVLSVCSETCQGEGRALTSTVPPRPDYYPAELGPSVRQELKVEILQPPKQLFQSESPVFSTRFEPAHPHLYSGHASVTGSGSGNHGGR